MIINYSGQPFESVFEMQCRTKCSNVLYEEVETLRVHNLDSGYKLVSAPYGVLRQTADTSTYLSRLCNKLNASDTRGVRYNFVTDNLSSCKDYLPKKEGEVKIIPRLAQRYVRINNVTPLFLSVYTDLRKVVEDLPNGLFICRYNDRELPVRIQVFAQSSDGLALVQMMYNLKPDLAWKYAIIDMRLSCEFYGLQENSSESTELDFGDDKLSQDQIDKLVIRQLQTL